MSYEFTKLSDVPAVSEFPEGANAIIETNGEIKRCPPSNTPKPLTYDYMPEGYPTKSVQTTTLMEEQELAFADMGSGTLYATPPEALAIAAGQTYTVRWDGTVYERVCLLHNGQIRFLGNLSILGMGDNTGEPFLYVTAEDSFFTLDASANHTISVTTIAEVVTPIDEKYLPTITADKLPTIPVIQFTTKISESIANDAQPFFTVSNLSYSEIYALVEKGNFQIKDSAGANYRPIRAGIESSGLIFVDILVIGTPTTYASLGCSANQAKFYRNKWWQIEATQK